MYKVISLYKRRTAIEIGEFVERMRSFARTFAEAPGCERYVLSLPLAQGYAKGELLFDAMEEREYQTLVKAQAASLSLQTESNDPRRPDDLIDRERMVVLIVAAHVAKDGDVPAAAVKNVEFVSRRPGMETTRFFDYWRDVHGPIARQIEYIWRYEQNHARPEYSPVSQPYDGLAITWFASTADMRAGTQTQAYQVTRADEPNFLPDGHLPYHRDARSA